MIIFSQEIHPRDYISIKITRSASTLINIIAGKFKIITTRRYNVTKQVNAKSGLYLVDGIVNMSESLSQIPTLTNDVIMNMSDSLSLFRQRQPSGNSYLQPITNNLYLVQLV